VDWTLYRSFLAVVRGGSLSAAARALGLTQPTVGRHVAELEAGLGAALFARSRTGLSPTDTALALEPHAEAMEAAANALVRAASGAADEPRGVVRLTASEIVGVEVLPPMLASFRARHPLIDVELHLSNVSEDLTRRDADLAVRMARPTQAALVARRVGAIEVGLFARRDYLARAGAPRAPADLRAHALVGFDRDDRPLRALRGASDFTPRREMFALRSDSDHAQLAAVRAGFGIGGVQVGVAARDRSLVRVLPNDVRFELETWLVMHEALRGVARVRLLFDHLAEGLGEYVRLRVKPPPRSRRRASSSRPSRSSSR
jgi:DNA-binding transcriptional LysR family regulator